MLRNPMVRVGNEVIQINSDGIPRYKALLAAFHFVNHRHPINQKELEECTDIVLLRIVPKEVTDYILLLPA